MMIVQSLSDFNATDSQGNTLLHNVICDALQDIDHFIGDRDRSDPVLQTETAIEMIKILLENGSYPHAKNKERKSPIDQIPHDKLRRLNPENIISCWKDLMTKYDCTLTLKYMAATKIVDYKISYKNFLPETLVKFVDLHWMVFNFS